jgi:hypothetical protein
MTPVRAVLSWLVLLVVAFLNGALRVVAYPPALGDFVARQVAAGVGAALLGGAMWILLGRWPVTAGSQAWRVGALWAGLTVVFELGLVRASGRPLSEALAQYALWKGSLWPLLVGWVLVAPWALARLRRSGVAVGATLTAAVLTWGACGAVLTLARSALGLGPALVLHLAAAPVVGGAATVLLWRHPRHPGPWASAVALAATAAYLDAIVVAPFVERSFAMFGSPVGVWAPLALLLAASAATGTHLARRDGAVHAPPA